jgi:hypothetical protein
MSRCCGVEDHDRLAAIGQVVVDAAVREYFIAVLVAAIEGRDEEWARRELAVRPGAARRALGGLVKARPDRSDLSRLCRDAVRYSMIVTSLRIRYGALGCGRRAGHTYLEPPQRYSGDDHHPASTRTRPRHSHRQSPAAGPLRGGGLGRPLRALMREHGTSSPRRENRVHGRAGGLVPGCRSVWYRPRCERRG